MTKTVAIMAQAKMFELQARMEQWVFGKAFDDREKVADHEGVQKVVNNEVGGPEDEGCGSCKDAKNYVDDEMRQTLRR